MKLGVKVIKMNNNMNFNHKEYRDFWRKDMRFTERWDLMDKAILFYLFRTAVIWTAMLIVPFMYISKVDAKDLGSYGKSYTISEPDIEADIKRKLEIYQRSGKLKEFEENYKKAVVKQIKEPNRVVGITNATKSITRKFDPTTELEEDIMIPKGLSQVMDAKKYRSQLDGKEIEYEVLHKAGTKINPLQYMKFNEPLIFVDGRNEDQLLFARNYQDKSPLSKIILIDGKPGLKEMNGKEYYYFFDQWGAYSEKFNISNVPAVVWQKDNEEVLTIDEIKLEDGSEE